MAELMVNVGSPRAAQRAAALPVTGVGLMRAEFLFYSLGKHPRVFIEEGGRDSLVAALYQGMTLVAGAFGSRPVRYRSLDFKSNEMRSLVGGEQHEALESNPALGLRGARRYRRDRDVFMTELEALRLARADGLTNLQLMIPFVRSADEIRFCRDAIREAGLDSELQLWAMLEVPAMIYMIDDLAPLIDGVSIGTNDLAQLMLGVDRDNEAIADCYDDGHPAVVRAACAMVTAARAAGLQTSICGDRPSRDPDFVRALLNAGIGSISVTSDAVEATNQILHELAPNA